jgi:sulfate adenylyltransferase
MVKLLELGSRPVTMLDGDIVRKHLSSELEYSIEHRDLNIWRIGFVATEISKNGRIALRARSVPYERVRQAAQAILLHLECEGDTGVNGELSLQGAGLISG